MNPGPHSKAAVAAAFGAAAHTYDDKADVQREVAERLAARLPALDLPALPRILEIGCGTGFLSRSLAGMKSAELVITDISEPMVARCRKALGAAAAHARFAVMDGEEPRDLADGGFDLICSSMAFQWFNDLPGSLERLSRLLAPGGYLVFATLAADSFHEWTHAHADLNMTPGVRAYPTIDVLSRMLPKGGEGKVAEEHSVRHYSDGHAFLAHLKHIGAHLSETSHRPLAAGALRRVLRQFEGGISVTYHLAYGIWRRS